MAKCDTPVELPGGLTAGCTLDAPHPGVDHEYKPSEERFSGKVLFCPVCYTSVEPSEDADISGLVRECDNCETIFALGSDTPLPVDEDLILEPEDIEEYRDEPFVLLCPQDQAQVDVTGIGEVTAVCPKDDCGITFRVNLNPETVAQHSMFG